MKTINYLPEDIFALIMDTRRKEMKKDKQLKDSKNNYDTLVNNFKKIIYLYKDKIYKEDIDFYNLHNIKLQENDIIDKSLFAMTSWDLQMLEYDIKSVFI